jgi:hypothetical protein
MLPKDRSRSQLQSVCVAALMRVWLGVLAHADDGRVSSFEAVDNGV